MIQRFNGGTWHYDLKAPEREKFAAELWKLAERKMQGWEELGVAVFIREAGKSLKLDSFKW